MKSIVAVAILLLSSSTLFASQKPGYLTSGFHHIKMSITSTTTKSINGIKSVMHLDAKHSK